ncbi:MAG: hypothetical protein IPN58_20085 [Anaerolineales bacterium]|nr:hypothetical protein [Anaerolineales bacterium]
MKHIYQIFSPLILILLLGTSCQSTPHTAQKIELANVLENKVQVSITLEKDQSGQFILSATFTPQDPNLHFYSKDIPITGINGIGRPTLLELPKDSPMQIIGDLKESVSPQIPNTPPLELLTYPAGAITLSLPILLPGGNNWIEDEVIVSYMACDENGCRPPVQKKSIAINIPGNELFQ